MSARFWIFVAAVLGGLAVVAGAIGAHKLPQAASLAVPISIFNTGQLYHALHALALFGVAILLLQSEGRRSSFANWFLQIAAAAFAIGIVFFSGGIYVQVAEGFTSSAGIVPFGGILLIVGWAALAIGALGLRD
jgi:uncharacterized membrane protein YgdD (TMEM256/DUF423 family)